MPIAVLLFLSWQTSAMAAPTLRVDSDRIEIPSALVSQWRGVVEHHGWTSEKSGQVGSSAAFSRFLPRSYEFRKVGDNLHIVTRWYSREHCNSTDRSSEDLDGDRQAALEDALGKTLTEVAVALEDPSATQPPVTVLWCQFRTADRELIPFDELSAADQQRLAPFADLARKQLSLATGPDANCDPQRIPRIRPRSSSSRNRSQGTGTGMNPGYATGSGGRSGAGSGTSGAAGSGSSTGQSSQTGTEMMKYPVLIEQYEARAGSLQFEMVRSFTRCISARSSQEALARASTSFPASIRGGDGQRVSFRVSMGTDTTGSTSCGSGGSAESGSGFGNTEDDMGPDGTTTAGGKGTGTSGNSDTAATGLSPQPDSIGSGGSGGPSSSEFEGYFDAFANQDIPFPDDYGMAPDIGGEGSPLISDPDTPGPTP
ncbi:hypothetical protein GC176_15620 [bacterium]|nr:hypothetical protein [bacterium]